MESDLLLMVLLMVLQMDEEVADGVSGGHSSSLIVAGSLSGGITSVVAATPIRPSSLGVSASLPVSCLLSIAGV